MKAAILWIVSDFPAYSMLSGWMKAGRLACPYYMEKTKSFQLKYGKKKHSWFDYHRQFLAIDHVFRKNKIAFYKNKVEASDPPPILNGEQVWDRVSKFPKSTNHCGKIDIYGVSHNWFKQSIFWELPYWCKLLVQHNLDVMYIEKNVGEQLIHTIMDVKGKTKDDVNARKDLAHHCKRQKLHVEASKAAGGERATKPTAPFALNKEQKKVLCEWIKRLKFPDDYASNLSRCVDAQGEKLYGLKSHHYHIIRERLLSIALREFLPTNVWKVITEISQFFKEFVLFSNSSR